MRDFSDRKINGEKSRVKSKGRSRLSVVRKFYWPELQNLLNSVLEPGQRSIAGPRDQKQFKVHNPASHQDQDRVLYIMELAHKSLLSSSI